MLYRLTATQVALAFWVGLSPREHSIRKPLHVLCAAAALLCCLRSLSDVRVCAVSVLFEKKRSRDTSLPPAHQQRAAEQTNTADQHSTSTSLLCCCVTRAPRPMPHMTSLSRYPAVSPLSPTTHLCVGTPRVAVSRMCGSRSICIEVIFEVRKRNTQDTYFFHV